MKPAIMQVMETNMDGDNIPSKQMNNKNLKIEGIQIKNEVLATEGNSNKAHRKRKKSKKDLKRRVKRVKNNPFAEALEKVNLKTYVCSSSSEENDFSLVVSNLPNTWSYLQFKEHIVKTCGPVDEIQFLKKYSESKYSVKLTFTSYAKFRDAYVKLKDTEVDGNTLAVEIDVTDSQDTDSDTSETTHVTKQDDTTRDRKKSQLDVWDIDPKGLYGLKLSFLKSLDIDPPIDKWVHVSNFRCDKSELRDVMELAGHVLMCSVFTVSAKYAKVMYSHPLEAVQAVSMLNGHQFYGKPLKVIMEKSPKSTLILPKGLASIGAGLGLNGKPLRNIVKHYQRYLNKDTSETNTQIFEDNAKDLSTFKTEDIEMKNEFEVKNVEELSNHGADKEVDTSDVVLKSFSPAHNSPRPEVRLANPNQNIRTIVTTPAFPDVRPQFGAVGQRPNFFPNRPLIRPFPMNCPQGPRFSPMRPLGPITLGGPRPIPNCMPRPPAPQMLQGPDSCAVQMSNLPPSTTFPLLCDKLNRCGQVVSLQFTTPGCAIVRFAQRTQAQMCFQTYNGFNVDGYVIGVKLI